MEIGVTRVRVFMVCCEDRFVVPWNKNPNRRAPLAPEVHVSTDIVRVSHMGTHMLERREH